MSQGPIFERETLLQLNKEELVEIIDLQAEAMQAMKAATNQAIADVSHHASRMAGAMQAAHDEIEAAGASYDARWSALRANIGQRLNGN